MARLASSRVACIWLASLCALVACVPALPLLESGDASGFVTFDALRGEPYNVTYDGRSLMLNGARSIFLSGAVHYPRATPAMWPAIAASAKKLGLNMVETYAFWNVHEPVQGELQWSGGANLTAFLQVCADAGLFVTLRIGPYVCAEWDYGGLPTWLGFTPGLRFREYNEPWLNASRAWFRTVVSKLSHHFPQSGGPVVLVQVENELYGASDQYVQWCGDMADEELRRAGVRVPVIMCNGQSADNTINTCNAEDCVSFLNSNGQNGRVLKDQPALLTELEGGYQVWGESVSNVSSYFYGRPAEDTAFAVARWFARGGSLNNYYMLFGGNNYGRIAGNSMTTAYAQDAPMCPDGLPHEPTFSHLARLHAVLAARADALLSQPAQLRHGVLLEWYDAAAGVWKADDQNLTCFVYDTTGFLENAGAATGRAVRWRSAEFFLPARTMVIADAATGVAFFNSSAPGAARVQRRVIEPASGTDALRWAVWSEPLMPNATAACTSLVRATPAEQTDVTAGLTDYLWYETNVTLPAKGAPLLRVAASTSLSLVAWLNGALATTRPVENHDHDAGLDAHELVLDLSQAAPACAPHASCLLTLLSVSIGGVPNYPIDPNSTRFLRGIVGNVTLDGLDITAHAAPWRMRPGLVGQRLQAASGGRVPWAPAGNRVQWPPGTWLRTRFATPSLLPPASACLLNLTGLGRGRAHVNGHDIGRYWLLPRNDGSGQPSQRFYHAPPDWLNAAGELNELVLFEDEGAPDVSLVGVVVSRMVDAPVRFVPPAHPSARALLHSALDADDAPVRAVKPCEF